MPRATPGRPVQPAPEQCALPHTEFSINSFTQLSGVSSISLVKNCSLEHDNVPEQPSENKFKNFIVSLGEMLLTDQSLLQLTWVR